MRRGNDVELDVGPGLAFSASARYMVTEAEQRDRTDALDIDPVTLLVGVGYRF